MFEELSLHVLDIAMNSLAAGAKRVEIAVVESQRHDFLILRVRDNGCGMNQEQLAHVFDPLYTTRRQVGGSGLGMSVAYGIVQGHEGHMEVQSKPGMGTTVTIDLPVAEEPEEEPSCLKS